jgi:hypothetical protein
MINLFKMRYLLFILAVMVVSVQDIIGQACTGSQLTLSIVDARITASNKFTYELWVQNTGSVPERISAYGGGIVPNVALTTGYTVSVLEQPSALGWDLNNMTPNVVQTTNIRWTNNPNASSTRVLNAGSEAVKIAKFEVTSTAIPASLTFAISGTVPQITSYCSGNPNSNAMTRANSKLVFANNNEPVIITAASPVIVTLASQTNVTGCFGDATGAIDIDVSGGSGSYTYDWSNDGPENPDNDTQDLTDLTAGTYTVTVTDGVGTTGTLSVTITQPEAVSPVGTPTHVSCFGGSNGSISLVVTGGTGGYTYDWSNDGPDDPDDDPQNLTDLTAGSYTVTVTDANGCSATTSVTVNQPSAVTASITAQTNVACNGGTNGSATVTADGGTPGYTYSWSTSPAQTGATATGLAAGSYTVIVTDDNGCQTTASATITEPTLLTSAITEQTDVACNGGTNGSATVTADGGTPGYTYSWSTSPAQTGATATDLAAGTYMVIVTDANGCQTTASATITEPALLTSAITAQTNVACNGGSNGSATVNAAGGTPGYSYSWSTNPVQTGATATGLAAGTYTVTVTDDNGCQVASFVTITEPDSLMLFIYQENASCNGLADGIAIAEVSGGTPEYDYLWNTVPEQTAFIATDLAAGTYTVTVTDANGCQANASVTITEPAILTSIITSQINVSCNGLSDGSATVTAAGGTPEYTYSWNTSPAQTAASATGLAAGTYMVTVTDANGCQTISSVTITEPATLTSSITAQINVSCGGTNGSATVTATGGTTEYTYLWNTNPAQTDATATGLSAGTYTVTVTDNNGCQSTASATITEPVTLTLSITAQTDVSCNGGSNGSATVAADGGTPQYTYSWNTSPMQTGATATGLAAGTYTVTVTDANSCTGTTSVTINEPATAVSASITAQTNVSCNGGVNGSATVAAEGGTPGYTYSWSTSPAQTGATATDLAAGTYTVTVTDNNGCQATVSVTITEPAILTSSITAQINVSCNGGMDGSATVTADGGTSPYGYIWSNGQINQTAMNLAAGTYTVTVTDSNGCQSTSSATITEPANLTSSITAQTYVSCNGLSDGSATVTAAGGTPGYTYSWSTSPAQTDATATGLAAGTYTVTVTDSNGCQTTASVTITEPATLTSSIIAQTNVSCNGGSNGSVTVTADGGTPEYTYSWNTNPAQTGATASGLAAGTYTVTVTDSNGCQSTSSVTITEPSALTSSISAQTNVSCNGGANGAATVTADGGTPGYTYSWSTSPAQTGTTASGLAAGSYTVTVTDSNGCQTTSSVTITEPLVLTSSISAQTNVSCNGGANGSATVTADGGTAPYEYTWSNGQMTQTATGLSAGSYTVTVTDNNGCHTTSTVIITEPAALMVSMAQINVSCNGLSDGSATVTASGGSTPYSYDWEGTPFGDGTVTITGLAPDTYMVTVTDNNSCQTTASVTITEPAPLTSSITSQTNVSCNGGSDGNATVTPVGGTAPYGYLWSNGQMTQTAINLAAGAYDVTVTDNNGCTSGSSVTITQPDVLIIETIIVNEDATVTCGTSEEIQTQFDAWRNPGATYTGGAAPVTLSINYLVVAHENGDLVTKYNGPDVTAPSEDGGYTEVTWTVTDNCGNTAAVSRTFNVLSCPRVSGKLNYYRDNAAVNGVNVSMLQGSTLINSNITSVDGSYSVLKTPITATGNYDVVPDEIRVCGTCTTGTTVNATNLRNIYNISVEDVDAIKAHVAAGAQFTNIYQRAAANVVLGTPSSETNNRLNSADATALSQAINGNLSAQARLWRRAIPRDTILTFGAPVSLPRSWGLVPPGVSGGQNPSQYGDYPSRIRYNALSSAFVNQDFAVVQVGDVVAHPGSSFRDGTEARYAGTPLIWKVKDLELVAGESFEADFKIEQMQDLRAWQFGLQFDTEYLKVEAISTSGTLSLNTDENFGLYRADEGEIRSLWAEGVTRSLNKGESVFKLRFTVLRGGKSLSEVLSMEEDMSGTFALTDSRDQVGVLLSFDGHIRNQQSPVLHQNVPNPFNRETLIRFELPSDSPVQLSICDVTGRLVKRVDGNYSKGLHEVRFLTGDLGQYTGILYYTLSCGDYTSTRKMVVIE